MSDYTPTTEAVRNAWANEHGQEYWSFNRWLAEVVREAKEEAWSEGYHEGMYADWSSGNPYRDIS